MGMKIAQLVLTKIRKVLCLEFVLHSDIYWEQCWL